MGYLSSCYRTIARLHPDSPPVAIRWYFAPPGAKVFEPLNRFYPNLWRAVPMQPGGIDPFQMPQLPDIGVGEIGQGCDRHTVRSWNPGYKGQCFVGEPSWYSQGVPLDLLLNPPPANLPECCGRFLEGGVEVGGQVEGGVEVGGRLIEYSVGGVEVGGQVEGGVEVGGQVEGGVEVGGEVLGGVEVGGSGSLPATCGDVVVPDVVHLVVEAGTTPCTDVSHEGDAVIIAPGNWHLNWPSSPVNWALNLICTDGVLLCSIQRSTIGTGLIPPTSITSGPPFAAVWDLTLDGACTGTVTVTASPGP